MQAYATANAGLVQNTNSTQQFNNVGIKYYLCPARSRNQYSTTGANSPSNNGPFTDYKMNWNTFTNESNNPSVNPNRRTLEQITNNRGSSNLIYAGEGFLDTNDYTRTHASNWEENIYSGGYGGTGRGSSTIQQDCKGCGQGDKWGGPHSGVTLFSMCDGSVKTVRNSMSGNINFTRSLLWNDPNPASLDN